jgi:hypothetical protein
MRIRYTATLKALNNVPTDLIIFCNQQFQTVGAWMDCDGQWLHRMGTTRNLFVGKRYISSVNWRQQLLPRVRCGNLLALQRRTCEERTRVPAQSVSVTFHPFTHPCHLVSTLLLEGAHILEAHMPGARKYSRRESRIRSADSRQCSTFKFLSPINPYFSVFNILILLVEKSSLHSRWGPTRSRQFCMHF